MVSIQIIRRVGFTSRGAKPTARWKPSSAPPGVLAAGAKAPSGFGSYQVVGRVGFIGALQTSATGCSAGATCARCLTRNCSDVPEMKVYVGGGYDVFGR